MQVLKARSRPFVFVAALLTAVAAFPFAGSAVTRSQVDEACADSQSQLAAYREARSDFEEAALAYEDVLNQVEILENKQARIQDSVDHRSEDLADIEAQIEEQAVELYMMGGMSDPGMIISASTVDEFLTTSEFLSSAAAGGQETVDALLAARSELSGLQDELDAAHSELKAVEAEALELLNAQQDAMEREQAAYAELSGRCKELTAKYEEEQAAARAAARQRAAGAVVVGSFNCPFTPGRTSFIDSWGFPRSGGRTHKGTDLFAAWNEPMYAVASGTVTVKTSSLGGKTVWLTANNGVAYYYAHLSDWAVGNGQRVSQGQTIGFNGDTGNARGGAPHLHFEIHPGGRGSAAVNPYSTLVGACK